MSGKNQWTMNCVLTGARAIQGLQKGDEDSVKEWLTNLTSELSPEEVDYLLSRLKELVGR